MRAPSFGGASSARVGMSLPTGSRHGRQAAAVSDFSVRGFEARRVVTARQEQLAVLATAMYPREPASARSILRDDVVPVAASAHIDRSAPEGWLHCGVPRTTRWPRFEPELAVQSVKRTCARSTQPGQPFIGTNTATPTHRLYRASRR